MTDILQPLVKQQRVTSDARKVLRTRPSGVRGEGTSMDMQVLVEKANIHGIIFPWMTSYKVWWALTALGAIFTVFFAPFQIAFQGEPGTFNDASAVVELVLTMVFAADIAVNFNLAFYKTEVIVFERKEIFWEYFGGMFWVDFVGVFPFETTALFIAGELGDNSSEALYYSLLRLLRFVRLHRMKHLSDILQYNARVSLLWFTLIRNFAVVLCVTHVEACIMYFLARLRNFGEETWLGPIVEDMTGFERYVTALYWSIVTFCTVGYGDFSPVNPSEEIWGSVFMLFNIVVAAWIIGSITLLIVKGDERTGEYRDSLSTLHDYGTMHHFDAVRKRRRQDTNSRMCDVARTLLTSK